jgi:ABC-type uncharacterized transport system permease subunit
MVNSNSVSLVIAILDLAGFMLASGLLVMGFRTSNASRLWSRLGHLMFIVGTLAATTHALLQGTTTTMLAATIGWATIISWFVWQIELVGAFTSPVIAIILMSGIFFTNNSSQPLAGHHEFGMRVHVAAAILGQAFAILACGMSLLLLWLDKKLKNKQLAELPVRFPGINTLNNALYATLWAGFIFITISLLTGSLYAVSGLMPNQASMLGKVTWAILVWLWYLSILVLKGLMGYRPQKVARMSLVGFLILAVSWFGLITWMPWGQP